MESGSQDHSPQNSSMLKELCNILQAWEINDSIMEVRHWSHMGVYTPDLIREFQVHVSKYR